MAAIITKATIEEALNILENDSLFIINRNSKLTKSKIVDALVHEGSKPLYVLLGYSDTSSASKAMKRSFNIDKPPQVRWNKYILEYTSVFKPNKRKVTNIAISAINNRKEYDKQYYILNKNKIRLKTTKRRKCIKIRTPKWAELEKIREFYSNCKDGYHVDHILPLQGKLVSGLHCLANLQYLTAKDNLAKSNKFDV